MNATEPTPPALAALFEAVRSLPAELIREVADFAEFLGRKRAADAAPAEDADWTDEDHRAHRIASLRRFEQEHGEENWGEDYGAPGGTACSPPVT
jgi:hypothetical protein